MLKRLCKWFFQKVTSPQLRIPRVHFRMAGTNVDYELGHALENRLRQRFQVTAMRMHTANWAAAVTVGKKHFGAMFSRERDRDVCLLQVPDWNGNLWQMIRGRPVGVNSSELKAICKEIHGLLNATPMVSEVYGWRLEGPHGHTDLVATPDELPWSELKVG